MKILKSLRIGLTSRIVTGIKFACNRVSIYPPLKNADKRIDKIVATAIIIIVFFFILVLMSLYHVLINSYSINGIHSIMPIKVIERIFLIISTCSGDGCICPIRKSPIKSTIRYKLKAEIFSLHRHLPSVRIVPKSI